MSIFTLRALQCKAALRKAISEGSIRITWCIFSFPNFSIIINDASPCPHPQSIIVVDSEKDCGKGDFNAESIFALCIGP